MDTKGERRERKHEKSKRRMSQGKKAKMLHRLIMERAAHLQKTYEEERDVTTH